MAIYRFKLNLPERIVLKLRYMPKVGETVTIYGKVYIIEKIILVKANFYHLVVGEEVRMPIVIKKPKIPFWHKIMRGGK